ncbi:aldehyde dehydrogenase family protein [Microbacterium trichothecenolyticum]|uniref:Aldehyde dehydrogenase family protein n=1 Tax=Microbacterium ureisolvens TaxID=2781186 RepID=A0ABS7I872_9MICO|nr:MULTISPECIES: aldehyde dehydrogenase family protein [Microbacterium]MBW9111898.1 aldehyde dehydrogenase family protein [Microbacterium ureisolvens]MBW9122255.1 aldehyde dehydrogenase family protein [Microbacterium trichothecenolyticum]
MPIATVNPATGQTIRTFEELTDGELETRLQRAQSAFQVVRRLPLEIRTRALLQAADILDADEDRLADLLTLEMGKIRTQALAEVRKSAYGLRYYAEHAAQFLAARHLERPADVNADQAYAVHQPLGPVLAVMPWNFPLWQVIRFAAPALAAGNVGLLKHASNVPQSALYLEELFSRTDLPDGAFQTLLISAGRVEKVLRDDRVVAVTLTGSEPAGRSVAAIAGDEVKKSVLELGGSDPFLVQPSADLDRAADIAVIARTSNNGQACINAKRFIVHTAVYDDFLAKLTERFTALVVGDPADEGTDIGPLALESGRTDVDELVQDAVRAGARVITGGAIPEGAGWFYPPTIIADVPESARLYREEVFGPVAIVLRAENLDEAIDIANDVPFGLGAAAWTRDADEQRELIERLDSASVTLNDYTISFPELPFGGVKRSGYGRELSEEGMHEFTNLKSVRVRA